MSDPQKLLDVASQTLLDCINAVKAGGQWIAGQIPDVLHQLIMWTIFVGVAWGVAFVCAVTLGALATFKWSDQSLKKTFYGQECWKMGKIISCVIWLISSSITLIGFLMYIGDALKAAIAPKLFLLQYAADVYRYGHG